jgi:hypothetical protein
MAAKWKGGGNKFAAALSVVSLGVALMSLVYTIRTYNLSYRPYVGVVRTEPGHNVPGQSHITWRLVLKNTGSVPALVAVEENRISVTTDKRTTILPNTEDMGKPAVLMPGQEAVLPSGVVDSTEFKIADLLAGQSVLEVRMRIVYEPSGARWWRDKYHYAVHYRLHPFPQSPASSALTMVGGDAD